MVDAFMPDVVVEIAFDSGYNTPAASRTWTDVSQWVELDRSIGVDFGRQDERSTADANGLSLVLDNTDGRFTANRSASPYYPNVKIGRPIRVTATPPGGVASVRFTGFIDEWPTAWDGTDAYAYASVRASSRLARLGLSTKLRSMLEESILSSQPSAYWPLGDSSSASSAVETSGNGVAPLVLAGEGAAVTFGSATGPAGDGLTAAQFAGGQYLTYSEVRTSDFQGFAFECFFLRDGAPAATECILTEGSEVQRRTIAMNTSGQIEVRVDGVVVANSAGSYADGETHHVAIRRWGGLFPEGALYVDGVEVDGLGGNFASLRVSVGGGDPLLTNFTGVVAHVAAYLSLSLADLVSAAQLIAHTTATNAERTDERLTRILGWAGVASTEVTVDTGAETMTYQETSGQSVVDALRDVESTEAGVLFDGRDGNVTFHGRSRRYTATPAATFDMAAQHVGADYAPKLDRSTLANDVTAENPTTGESARQVDTASVDEYGVATDTARVVADTADPLLQHAAWRVGSYAEPRPRVPSLTVDVLAHVGATPSAQTILGLTVGDLIEVTNQPSQADATDAQYFIEGYTETIGPESYTITFNLSPSHPYVNTFVIGDAVRGAIETGGALAL